MANIDVGNRLRVLDPNYDLGAEQPPALTAQGPTANRLTLQVPTEHTTLSMGAPSAEHIDDPGITGQTDNHVHFHVAPNSADSTSKATFVSLGAPPQDGAIQTLRNDPFEAGVSALGQAQLWHGLALVTEGKALSRSVEDHWIASRSGNVYLHAEGGDIRARGEKRIVLRVGSDKDDISNLAHLLPEYAAIAPMVIGIPGVFVAALTSCYYKRKARLERPGWERSVNAFQIVGMLASAGGVAYKAYSLYKNLSEPAGEGTVAIKAPDHIVLATHQTHPLASTSVFGTGTVNLDTFGVASVTAGIAAMVNSPGVVGMLGGLKASIRALNSAELSGDLGRVVVRGRKSAEVSSQNGTVVVASKKAAQLNSTDDSVYIHGKGVKLVASDNGDGFAIKIDPDRMTMGKAVSPDILPYAAISYLAHVSMEEDKVEARGGTVGDAGTLTLDSNGAKLGYEYSGEGTNVHVQKSNVRIQGQRVELL